MVRFEDSKKIKYRRLNQDVKEVGTPYQLLAVSTKKIDLVNSKKLNDFLNHLKENDDDQYKNSLTELNSGVEIGA